MDRILPEYGTVSREDIEEAVFQALGFASVCWTKITGTFESEKAEQVGEELLYIIEQYAADTR